MKTVKQKKYTVYTGGGATFYLSDTRSGKGITIVAPNKAVAKIRAEELLNAGNADWLLSDDPEPDGEMLIDELKEVK